MVSSTYKSSTQITMQHLSISWFYKSNYNFPNIHTCIIPENHLGNIEQKKLKKKNNVIERQYKFIKLIKNHY